MRPPFLLAPLLLAPLLLAGCASLGRSPLQTDVACIRQQMALPAGLVFPNAASRCQHYTDDRTLTQLTSRRIPLNLAGAPDLQADAAQAGIPFTR